MKTIIESYKENIEELNLQKSKLKEILESDDENYRVSCIDDIAFLGHRIHVINEEIKRLSNIPDGIYDRTY